MHIHRLPLLHPIKTVALITLSALLLTGLNAESRLFTDTQGRTIQAELLKVDGDMISIKREDGIEFHFKKSLLSPEDNVYIEAFAAAQAEASLYKGLDTRIRPNNTFTLHFPELPPMADNREAQCEVHIPKNYTSDKPVPIFVWFNGGKGDYRVDGAKGLVDFDQFVVVALPYPNGKFPRIAVDEGDIDAHWKFQKPMLDKIRELIPNIDPNIRIAGGTSSGAHNVGSGLNQKWHGFYDYFNAFILHEGGYAPSTEYKGASRKLLLVIWGEKSTAREWQAWFNKKIDASRAKITFISLPNAGHGLTGEGKNKIREWIQQTAIPKLQ